MKKGLLLSALVLVVFSSCKKDRTCTCEQNGTTLGTGNYTQITRKDARALCDAAQAQYQTSYPGTTCSLR